ncbi:Cathepsin L [Araneus ventricosus]|uniref:Cathepsin L n=1 Tax=Araneus ventricosus TaxID=182803 RepID=A0A4Y2DUY9_ARAVE|nr:Cathepsin L [Araneus ventricosus]
MSLCFIVLMLVVVQAVHADNASVVLVILPSVSAEFSFNIDHWGIFKKMFKKVYEGTEEEKRRKTFEEHVKEIMRHNIEYNLGIQKYRKGLNQFADMEHDQFVKQFNGYRGVRERNSSNVFNAPAGFELPYAVDWRQKSIVTHVKDQQQCGSCYTFSAAGALEGQYALKTGRLVSLSEQNLLDCSSSEGNLGCQGGWMNKAFEYVRKNGGIDTEQSYPYTAQVGTCRFNQNTVGATCRGYVDIPSGDERALKQAVASVGPVSVAIDASQYSFQLYSSGIYYEPKCSSQKLDHAVLAVGYGTENGVDYWLVKNSWGTSWGENGYMKIVRNMNNLCGIATQASYPLV